jgi:hypothetical protein
MWAEKKPPCGSSSIKQAQPGTNHFSMGLALPWVLEATCRSVSSSACFDLWYSKKAFMDPVRSKISQKNSPFFSALFFIANLKSMFNRSLAMKAYEVKKSALQI